MKAMAFGTTQRRAMSQMTNFVETVSIYTLSRETLLAKAALPNGQLGTDRTDQPQVTESGMPPTRSQDVLLSQSSWPSVNREPATKLFGLQWSIA